LIKISDVTLIVQIKRFVRYVENYKKRR